MSFYNSFGYETVCQVRHSSFLVYGHYVGDRKKSLINLYDKSTGEKHRAYSGQVTFHTQKRIKKTVDLLLQLTDTVYIYNTYKNKYLKHRLSLITLTIPDYDKDMKLKWANHNLLRPFLRYFKDNKIITTYIWKAELQQRGAIHYHITTPSYVDINDVRIKWNQILLKHNLMSSYIKKYGNKTPPSTEVKEVFSIKGMQCYIQKEISKAAQALEGHEGKVWDCSENLKGVSYFTIPMSEGVERMIWWYDQKGVLNQWFNDQCTVLSSNKIHFKDVLNTEQRKAYNSFIESLKRFRNLKTERIT